MTEPFRIGPPGYDFTQTLPAATDLGRVHFLGIGGIGMSGIAFIMLARGISVSGSDAKQLPVLEALTAAGATVGVGFDAARLAGVDTVVASSAIRADNVELAAARAQGLRVLHRAQALAALMLGLRGVAVAGTNGKTTTTSMLVEILRHSGADPSFAIGGELVSAGSNAGVGNGDIFVAEADESDASFLAYEPVVSVVTNVQPDHLDHYRTPAAVAAAFDAFADRLGPSGTLIACIDDAGAAALAARRRAQGHPVVSYGRASDADIPITEEQESLPGNAFQLNGTPVTLPVPGAHNVQNAAGAFAAALALGLSPAAAAAGLAVFSGAKRRFEFRGEAAGVAVYDDYAHNPPKVAAAVATALGVARARGGRLIACFQPHLYSRTRDFAAEFGAALSPADRVLVADVYGAREDPMPGVTGQLVVDRVQGAAAQFVPDVADLPALVASAARTGDVVVTIGAGDITAQGPRILAALNEGNSP